MSGRIGARACTEAKIEHQDEVEEWTVRKKTCVRLNGLLKSVCDGCHTRQQSHPLLPCPGLLAWPWWSCSLWRRETSLGEENEHGCKLGSKTWPRARRRGQLKTKAGSVSGRMEADVGSRCLLALRRKLLLPCSSSMWASMMLPKAAWRISQLITELWERCTGDESPGAGLLNAVGEGKGCKVEMVL